MPGLCERRGGVHSGGRYAQMCTFSRPCACEYQVLSGSPARMLKKRQVLTGFFFTGLAQSRAHQRRSVSGTVRGIVSGCVFAVRFSCILVAGCAFYCVFQRQHLSSFCAALSASSLLPGNKEVQQPPERRALCPARAVCRSRLHHGFTIDCKRITKDNISEVSICQHTSG